MEDWHDVAGIERHLVAQATASDDADAIFGAFCDALVGAAKNCSATADKAACLRGTKIYNDETIAQAVDCTKKACSEINSCLSATLDIPSSGSSGSSPITLGSASSYRTSGRTSSTATPA